MLKRRFREITVHSLTQESWDERILHTRKDKLAEIQFADYYRTYRLMSAYVVFLDQLPPRHSDAAR